MNKVLTSLLVCLVCSSGVCSALFLALWWRYDFDYAWGTFEAIIEDTIG